MKAKKKRKMKSEQMKKKITRRGVILISVLAVLILLVNLITASYSWFTPKTVSGAGMQYLVDDAHVRSEQCTFTTYKGTKRTTYDAGHYIDQIEYNTEITTDSVPAGQTRYFRTSIVNADTNYASDISLYLTSFGQANCNLTVAVTYPSNTVRTVECTTEPKYDYCLVRNAYVKVHDDNDVDGPGLLEIDWFVTNNASSGSVPINVGPIGGSNANMYIMYN